MKCMVLAGGRLQGVRAFQLGSALCLPREDSFLLDPEGVAVRHPNWRLVECPACGDGCYISPDHERLLLTFPGLRATCTRCALAGKAGD